MLRMPMSSPQMTRMFGLPAGLSTGAPAEVEAPAEAGFFCAVWAIAGAPMAASHTRAASTLIWQL
jgi:hypothetical protein